MKPEDGLRRLGQITAPDLWSDIQGRTPRGEPPGPGWRFVTIVVALAVAAAGLGLAAVAFLGDPQRRPVAPPSPTPTRPAITTPSPDTQFHPTHSDPWGAPTTLSVTCTREPWGIEPLTPEVPAQPDGVHIVVDNAAGATHISSHMKGPPHVPTGGRTLRYSLLDPDRDGFVRLVATWPPGPVELACEAPGIEQGSETVRVTDPDGQWISAVLSCEETVPYEREKRQPDADLERNIRNNVSGVLSTDEIVRAGYPQDTFPAATMLVVRDGEPVAAITLIYIDGEAFWIPSYGEICVGSGIMGA
jgi:hypothetical protein